MNYYYHTNSKWSPCYSLQKEILDYLLGLLFSTVKPIPRSPQGCSNCFKSDPSSRMPSISARDSLHTADSLFFYGSSLSFCDSLHSIHKGRWDERFAIICLSVRADQSEYDAT